MIFNDSTRIDKLTDLQNQDIGINNHMILYEHF
jgi:hypothetical protein